jgi:cell wall-associated NlpC family hydrolase
VVLRKEIGVLASSGPLRSLGGVLSATVLVLVSCLVFAGTAQAVPEPPPPPAPPVANAAAQLADAQRDAEALTEQWHAAQDQVQAKQDEARRAQAEVEPARAEAVRAQRTMSMYRAQLDQLTSEALEGGRLDQLNALVLSKSPADFLGQMTTLDTYSAGQKAEMDHALAMVNTAKQAQDQVAVTLTQARQAADQARQAVVDIGVRKKQADVRIEQVQNLLARLTPGERAARTRSDGLPIGVILGDGKGALALKAAMTRFDMPYVWGSTGPGTFDCSGLVYWAFKRVGITLPRSSAAQSQIGRPVAKGDLRPGDLIFFYHPVSHVGIYAGDGKVLNAVQAGDVVRYTDLSKMKDYNSARRL